MTVHIVLEDSIAAVEAATARRDALTAQIEAMVPSWSLAPVVHALQALRGIAPVAAATLVAELGDVTRFANARHLMAYLGLVPSEHSSGETRRQSGITKASVSLIFDNGDTAGSPIGYEHCETITVTRTVRFVGAVAVAQGTGAGVRPAGTCEAAHDDIT